MLLFVGYLHTKPSDAYQLKSLKTLIAKFSETVIYAWETIYLLQKCGFNKITKQLYWNHASAWVYSGTGVFL